jgi:tRNA threonylcarbamoyladenosine biosynthesis protein TsaE
MATSVEWPTRDFIDKAVSLGQNNCWKMGAVKTLVNCFATIELSDEAATQALGMRLAPLLGVGDVVALTGDLGAGKTSLARALLRARAGSKIEVPSPTFTLAQVYELPGLAIWHFDLYRLKAPADVYEIGWEEALATGASLVEWPERLGALLPGSALTVALDFKGESRVARLSGDDKWAARW